MSKLNFRKIPRSIVGKLSLNEAYIYYCMAMKSDYMTQESRIKRETLAAMVGTTKQKTITDALTKFQKLGLLKIERERLKGGNGLFNRNTYHLIVEGSHDMISNSLLEVPEKKQLKAFLVLLKLVTRFNSNDVIYNQENLATTLSLTRPTVNKYLNEAINKGYIKAIRNGYRLVDSSTFIITRQTNDSRKDFYKEYHDEICHWAIEHGMKPPKFNSGILGQIRAHYPDAEDVIKKLEERMTRWPEAISLEYIKKALTYKIHATRRTDDHSTLMDMDKDQNVGFYMYRS